MKHSFPLSCVGALRFPRRLRFLSLLLISIPLFSQESTPPAPLLRESVSVKYDAQNGIELGDTVHLSAYVTREKLDGPTDYSRILYVELLNPEGTVIQRRKLLLTGGRATTSLWVDSIYGTGFYQLRAYTRYMTNWNDYGYWARLLPVFRPADPLHPTVRTLCLKSAQLTTESIARHMKLRRDTIYGLSQPVERRLMYFGHIAPRKPDPEGKETDLNNRGMKLQIFRPGEAYDGDVYTDAQGYFALYFPDVIGHWSLRAIPIKSLNRKALASDVTHTFIVSPDELFAPKPRLWAPSDFSPENFGYTKWKEERDRIEGNFIDCDYDILQGKQKGFLTMDFYNYLGRADRRFLRTTGFASPTVLNVLDDSTHTRSADINLYGKDSNDPRTVCIDGPSFQGRPVVWIVDGCYRLVTGLAKRITDFEVFRPTTQGIPIYLDEVRSIFISQSPTAHYPYVRCSVLEKKRPVTVFITTRPNFLWDDSGLLSSFFYGYDE